MIIKEIINEVFFDYVHSSFSLKKEDMVEVYLNPTSKEIKNIKPKYNIIRFVAVKKGKKVYVFEALKLVHFSLLKKLNISSNEIVLNGTAIKKNNEYVMMDSDEILSLIKKKKKYINSYNKVKKILETDWSFVNKYIKVDEYLKKIKIDFKKN